MIGQKERICFLQEVKEFQIAFWDVRQFLATRYNVGLRKINNKSCFSTLYWICVIRWISWIQPAKDNFRLLKASVNFCQDVVVWDA